MGLGPSYQPNCPRCISNKVEFIYKDCNLNSKTRLKPWWCQSSLYNNESWYWACQNCVNDIPEGYRGEFKYIKNYTVRGM